MPTKFLIWPLFSNVLISFFLRHLTINGRKDFRGYVAVKESHRDNFKLGKNTAYQKVSLRFYFLLSLGQYQEMKP